MVHGAKASHGKGVDLSDMQSGIDRWIMATEFEVYFARIGGVTADFANGE